LKDFEINGCNTGIQIGTGGNAQLPQNIHLMNGEVYGCVYDGISVLSCSGLDAVNVS
jgi:hypothetical protein